ncbi:chromosome partitioning protein [Anaeromicropila populeti]|uniref:Chromosome partitioning protein n=1 Tax=Anaeromicropila populeti TaxID=37658 RepID=A0A1I6I703_9FIRM|nr:hypothetical protein [Anaeromicropila populeti]SFR62493.1 chromosome partitioning protein [Anaeromicropila populeti]
MYTERMNLSKEIRSMIETAYGKVLNIYSTYIPKSVRVGESALSSKSIIEYDQKNKVACSYREFAHEVLANDVAN